MNQRYGAGAVMALAALCVYLQATGPEALGLQPVAMAWIGGFAAMLTVIQGFLPAIHRDT